MGELGTAWTRGLQEGRGKETRFVQVAVTLKHFDANSVEGGSTGPMGSKGLGRHTIDVNISKYLLAEYYWPAFKAPIRHADAKGVVSESVGVRARRLAHRMPSLWVNVLLGTHKHYRCARTIR